jgi:hypothetical protein
MEDYLKHALLVVDQEVELQRRHDEEEELQRRRPLTPFGRGDSAMAVVGTTGVAPLESMAVASTWSGMAVASATSAMTVATTIIWMEAILESTMFTRSSMRVSISYSLSWGMCNLLVKQLRLSAAMVRSLLRFIGPNELISKEYYRVVTDASRLLSCYREKPWLNSAIMLLDTQEDFRSILLDLYLCMRTMSTDNASASNIQEHAEYLPWKPYLKAASAEDREILRSKLLERSQGWFTTHQDRLLSDYLLNRMVMNDAKTQDGSLQPFVWNPDPQAKVGALLGTGSSGSVHKFTWFGLECAKKCFVCRTKAGKRVFQKEVGVMAYLNHPNVVKFICCHRDSDERAIVMEYLPTNLQDFIKQRVASSNTGFPFTPMAALDMISQIASGMKYLHGKKVVHRDLKPHNILVSPFTSPELAADGYAKLKLCDFGLAKSIVTSQSEQQSRVCGTRFWMAPEASPRGDALVPLQYRTKEADVYSFAIVCSQILSGADEPFPCLWNGFIDMISAPRNVRPELPPNVYPAKLLDLINKCWDPDPHQRPSFSAICDSLKGIKIDLLRT